MVPATAPGSVSWNVSAAAFRRVKAGGTVSIANGMRSDTVASGSVAVTTAVYWPSGKWTPAEVPSQPTVWNPGPSCPTNSVATTAPARCTVTCTGTFCDSAKPKETVSDDPSAFGENTAGVAVRPESVRSTTMSADCVDV